MVVCTPFSIVIRCDSKFSIVSLLQARVSETIPSLVAQPLLPPTESFLKALVTPDEANTTRYHCTHHNLLFHSLSPCLAENVLPFVGCTSTGTSSFTCIREQQFPLFSSISSALWGRDTSIRGVYRTRTSPSHRLSFFIRLFCYFSHTPCYSTHTTQYTHIQRFASASSYQTSTTYHSPHRFRSCIDPCPRTRSDDLSSPLQIDQKPQLQEPRLFHDLASVRRPDSLQRLRQRLRRRLRHRQVHRILGSRVRTVPHSSRQCHPRRRQLSSLLFDHRRSRRCILQSHPLLPGRMSRIGRRTGRVHYPG